MISPFSSKPNNSNVRVIPVSSSNSVVSTNEISFNQVMPNHTHIKSSQSKNRTNEILFEQFGEGDALRAIAYDKVGDGKYPDWHMITPAFDLEFAGMTPVEHLTSFVSPGNQNNIIRRTKRWIDEKRVVTYSNLLAKVAAVISFLIVIMTMVITFWQLSLDAKISYTSDKGNPENLETLNSLANNVCWNWLKVCLSAGSGLIIAFYAYKRTTVPKGAPKITSFYPARVDKYKLDRQKARKQSLFGMLNKTRNLQSSPTVANLYDE